MVMIWRRKRRRIYRGGEYGSHTFYWTHISTNPFSTAPGGHHHHNIMSFDVYLWPSSARKYHSTLMMLEPAKQKIIGQLVLVINAWSLRSTPSVAVVISIVGKLSETGKSFKVYYPSPSVPRHVFITRTMYLTQKKSKATEKWSKKRIHETLNTKPGDLFSNGKVCPFLTFIRNELFAGSRAFVLGDNCHIPPTIDAHLRESADIYPKYITLPLVCCLVAAPSPTIDADLGDAKPDICTTDLHLICALHIYIDACNYT